MHKGMAVEIPETSQVTVPIAFSLNNMFNQVDKINKASSHDMYSYFILYEVINYKQSVN